ncbi:hypothetical protein F442_07579 [Phytophthora nicotianae P10297]|uniref:Uncharacterized protein n=2 Tax=Phytophthora nicotianae TaxID=4792 RepID=W2ZFJ4_PHYNI|nr:hypothetical protein F444_07582 [Phytophthora nicotianae P1976]ETP46127.1 hypothetical protein F442_07579 [Phytophthora nicotianae P10297]
MPWLEEVNPIIDWTAKTVRPRPDVQPAVRGGGRRCSQPRMSPRQCATARLQNYFTHGYHSEEEDPEMTPKAAAAWTKLEGTSTG